MKRARPASDIDDTEVVESERGGRACGPLGDDDLVRLGHLLEARRDIEDVAGQGPEIERTGRRGEQIAGVHPDARRQRHVEPEAHLAVDSFEPPEDRPGGAQRSLGVVFMRRGEPEYAEHPVPDERAYEAFTAFHL